MSKCAFCNDFQKELKEAEAERDQLQTILEKPELKTWLELSKATLENYKLQRTLGFYGDPVNYMTYQNYPERKANVVKDGGKRAQDELAECRCILARVGGHEGGENE